MRLQLLENAVRVADRIGHVCHWRYWTSPPSVTVGEAKAALRIREIGPADLNNVIDLLTIGYHRYRDRSYWINAIQRLTAHETPTGVPKYGHVLERNGTLVGVILVIFSSQTINGVEHLRCNGSSLYVIPAFSGYGALLVKRALQRKDVTYLNLTPARHTLDMLEVQGYNRFSNGVFVALPALSPATDLRIRPVETAADLDARLEPFEAKLLLAHVGFGCISVLCEKDGQIYPFVFALRRKYGIPIAHLVYSRDQQNFVCFAGALGRFLRRYGYRVVILDANGDIPELTGQYFAMRPKFAMGPEQMRLGDLCYTERVMFGY